FLGNEETLFTCLFTPQFSAACRVMQPVDGIGRNPIPARTSDASHGDARPIRWNFHAVLDPRRSSTRASAQPASTSHSRARTSTFRQRRHPESKSAILLSGVHGGGASRCWIKNAVGVAHRSPRSLSCPFSSSNIARDYVSSFLPILVDDKVRQCDQ